jgi:two-component system response regulator LytT
MKLNCITVDDEPLALNLVSSFAEQTPFLDLKGKYGNAVEALQALYQGVDRQDPIHVVFLDIQMPDLNGMELAKVICESNTAMQTRIIFTTAYNQFAVEGYKVDALDYLLKPFGYDEFLRASSKAKKYFEMLKENNVVQEAQCSEDYMFVKSDYKLVRVDFDSICYIESLKDYVRIYLAAPANPVVAFSSLKAIEDRLPAGRFLRVHRSFIVAINKVDAVGKNAVMIGNTEISVGDFYKKAFKALFSRWG